MSEDLILALDNGCLHKMYTLGMRYTHHRICNCISTEKSLNDSNKQVECEN